MKKLSQYVITSVVVVLLMGSLVCIFFEELEQAAYFSTTFSIGASVISGAAIGLAIYSFILQQKQNEEFQNTTIAALKGQVETLNLLKKSIEEQSSTAKVTALRTLITLEENRIKDLKEWGRNAGNENKYSSGVIASKNKIKKFREEIEVLSQF